MPGRGWSVAAGCGIMADVTSTVQDRGAAAGGAGFDRNVELGDDVIAMARQAAVDAAAEDAGTGGAFPAAGEAMVGEYLGALREGQVAAIARFGSRQRGYHGWAWTVILANVADGEPWTVSEVVLLPGTEALLPPEWVPWQERIRPGDLGAGDLLPTEPDDERLVPGYLQSDDPAIEESERNEFIGVATELGLGRPRVMSRDGRADLAQRWHEGEFGPAAEMAQQSAGPCVSCGFYLPLAGSLGAGFGVCGNEYSPADGRVVDVGYGCGAHSEAAAELVEEYQPPAAAVSVLDEEQLDVHPRPATADGGGAAADADPAASLQAVLALLPPPGNAQLIAGVARAALTAAALPAQLLGGSSSGEAATSSGDAEAGAGSVDAEAGTGVGSAAADARTGDAGSARRYAADATGSIDVAESAAGRVADAAADSGADDTAHADTLGDRKED